MADKKISQFTQATALDPTDLFVIQRGANNFSISGEKLINFVSLTTQEEGVDVDTSTNLINFIGTGVTASAGASPGEVDVTIPGDKIATQDTNALVQAPTATEDGYFIAWNDTNGEYELVLGGASALNDLTDVNVTGAAQGAILYKSATDWVHLAAGTSGQVLQTNGAGADPSWVNSGGNTIYNADDSLTGTRTVTMGEFNLNFSHNGVTTAKNQSLVYKTDQTDKQMRFEVTNDSVDNTKLFMKIIGSTYVSGTIDNYYKAKGIVQGGLDHDLLLVSQGTGGVEILTGDTNLATGVTKRAMSISSAQVVTLDNLSGVGSRMVVADASGVLSTQAIPSGGGDGIYGGSGSLSGATTVTMASNDLGFDSTGTANLLYFDSSFGSIGIATATPSNVTGVRLDISGNQLTRLNTVLGTSVYADNNSRLMIYGASDLATDYQLRTRNSSGDEVLSVRNDGTVGIGTEVSQASTILFEVRKNDQNNTYFSRLKNDGVTDGSNQNTLKNIVSTDKIIGTYQVHSGNSLGRLDYEDNAVVYSGTGTTTGFKLSIATLEATMPIQFYTGGGDLANRRMEITSTGRVGINQSTIGAQLHVTGASGVNPLQVDTNTSNATLIVRNDGTVGVRNQNSDSADILLDVRRNEANKSTFLRLKNDVVTTTSVFSNQRIGAFTDVSGVYMFAHGGSTSAFVDDALLNSAGVYTPNNHKLTLASSFAGQPIVFYAGGLTTSDRHMEILSNGEIQMNNLPTSNPGGTGKLWNNGGVLNIT